MFHPLRTLGILLLLCTTAFSQGNPRYRMTSDVVVGDLNDDGLPDMVIANINLNNVTVLLGNRLHKFKQVGRFPTGLGPTAIALGDFNNDHKLDVAVANCIQGAPDSVSILFGDGTGQLGAPNNSGTGGKHAADLATADLNHDGNLDLVIANMSTDNVTILLGHGDGTFGTPSALPVKRNPQGVVIADLNGDGNLDLAVVSGKSYVRVFRGHGDGTFDTGRSFPAFEIATAITVGDFNHDGRPDLAVADGNWHAQLVILLGNGDGTFQAPLLFYGGLEPTEIAVADFNGDGIQDIVLGEILDYSGLQVWVYIGNGDGTFQAGKGHDALTNITGVGVADFNLDGNMDIVFSDLWDGGVGVMLGHGDGKFGGVAFFEN